MSPLAQVLHWGGLLCLSLQSWGRGEGEEGGGGRGEGGRGEGRGERGEGGGGRGEGGGEIDSMVSYTSTVDSR